MTENVTSLVLCVFRETGLQEKLVWDPNTQRKRRKVLFAEEEGDDDVSGSSDDEDGDSEDSDQDEDEDNDNLSTMLKEARAKSDKTDQNVTDITPPVKKQKLEERKEKGEGTAEVPAFADSEDDLEMSEESEQEGGAGRAGDSGHCSEESDEEEEEEEDESVEEEDDEAGTTVKEEEEEEDEEEEEEEQGKSRLFVFICRKGLHYFYSGYLQIQGVPIHYQIFLFFTLNLYE